MTHMAHIRNKAIQLRTQRELSIDEIGDTYFRSRLQAWMDIIKNQW
jgi:hypothetical protein